jgi:hypothetical protein
MKPVPPMTKTLIALSLIGSAFPQGEWRRFARAAAFERDSEGLAARTDGIAGRC